MNQHLTEIRHGDNLRHVPGNLSHKAGPNAGVTVALRRGPYDEDNFF